jgi:hypothetical protein
MRRLNFRQDIRIVMLSSSAVMIAYFLFFGLIHSLLADPEQRGLSGVFLARRLTSGTGWPMWFWP